MGPSLETRQKGSPPPEEARGIHTVVQHVLKFETDDFWRTFVLELQYVNLRF